MFKKIIAKLFKNMPNNTKFRYIKPCDAFSYFSGYSSNTNNLPTMYAHNILDKKIIVIGKNFKQEFSITDIDKAIDDYKILLKKTGYI